MNSFDPDIENCIHVLQSGGIILYPTDTIWGIGCDATDAAAVERIIALKNRPENKSFVVLVATENELIKYVTVPDQNVFKYLETTIKPTTVIYESAVGLAKNVIAGDGSVAIRICRDSFCKQLIKRFGKPIVSTSANIAGMQPPSVFTDIDDAIKSSVDYMVKYKQIDTTIASPSSIIRWKDGKVEVIR